MVNMEIRRFPVPDYPIANAMNTLCTNLSFVGGMKRIMLTSCQPQEGKSYTAMHMLRTLARNFGLNTILVDADIYASELRNDFGIQIDSEKAYLGLSGYLKGRCDMDEIIGRTNIPGADMILAGKMVANSLPLFNSNRMKNLLDQLADKYDMVIVDAPPIGAVIDAARIATHCDGTLFVVASGCVRARQLKEAVSQIEKTGSPVIGYVLNKSPEKKADNDYYYGGYGM